MAILRSQTLLFKSKNDKTSRKNIEIFCARGTAKF